MPVARKNKVQQRVIKVLERMIVLAKESEEDAEMFSDGLQPMLTEIHVNDGFGKEGQCDPRGDFRDGCWSMTKIEGVDT